MNTYDMRNIAEQVLKNKEDILKHFQRDEVLADFGIRIIGQLDSPEELYRVPQEGLQYGDAYAVGTQSPFNYFIWTRANNLSPSDYWFDFGEIAIAGPQGPKGDRGPQGETGKSTTWISTFDLLNLNISNIPLDTMVLEYSSGNVYQVLNVNGIKSFSLCLNIKGPVGPKGDRGPKGDKGDTGPQGPKGATGDVGGFINIAGVVGSEYELADPALIQNMTVAYLVGSAEPYNLYIQVGSTSATAEWMDMGPLNVATMVTVNGQYQNTWDADTKLDKVSTHSNNNMVYVKSMNGSQIMTAATSSPAAWAIPTYDGEGHLKTSTPEAYDDCINKNYADATYGPITVPLDGLTITWDGDNYFDVPEEDFVYRITPYILANYGNRDVFYNIQLEPVILPVYADMNTQALSRGVISPTIGNVPDITELEGLDLFFRHNTGDSTEISIHLNEPQGLGDVWTNTGLELTLIVERLF